MGLIQKMMDTIGKMFCEMIFLARVPIPQKMELFKSLDLIAGRIDYGVSLNRPKRYEGSRSD